MRSHHLWYKLDENNNFMSCTVEEANEFLGKGTKHVRFTHIKKYDIEISTIFLSLDHNHYGNMMPILFETMIFWNSNEELDQYQQRYCTWDEALKGHRETVRMVIKELRKREKIKNGQQP